MIHGKWLLLLSAGVVGWAVKRRFDDAAKRAAVLTNTAPPAEIAPGRIYFGMPASVEALQRIGEKIRTGMTLSQTEQTALIRNEYQAMTPYERDAYISRPEWTPYQRMMLVGAIPFDKRTTVEMEWQHGFGKSRSAEQKKFEYQPLTTGQVHAEMFRRVKDTVAGWFGNLF